MSKNKVLQKFKNATFATITSCSVLLGMLSPVPIHAAVEETPFKAVRADNLFMVDGWGDLITSVIRKGDGLGSDPLGFCVAKQKKFPHEDHVLYSNVLDTSQFRWDRGDGTTVQGDTVNKVMKVIYDFNFTYQQKLPDYGLDTNDTMSLYDAAQVAIWSLIEGFTPDQVKKQPGVIADETMNAKADKIYRLFVDMYNNAQNTATSFKPGGLLLNVTEDKRVENASTIDVSNSKYYESNGVTYYRTPLLSLIPEQDKGIVWNGDNAYTYKVTLNGAPAGVRIVNEAGAVQDTFSTAPGVGTDFYIEVPTTNMDHLEAGSFTINVATSKFYRMQPILWHPTMDTAYQSIMQLGGVSDQASANITIKYPKSFTPEPPQEVTKAKITLNKTGVIYTTGQTPGSVQTSYAPQEGVGFEIYLDGEKGQRYQMTDGSTKFTGQKLLKGVQYTGASGSLIYAEIPMIKDAETTTYLIKEVEPANGYKIGTNAETKVVVEKSAGGIANINIANEPVDITVNTPTKRVEQLVNNEISEVPAKDVEFTLFTGEDITYKNGAIMPANTAIYIAKTNNAGQLDLSSAPLLVGYDYYLQETNTPYKGTIMDQTKYVISLKGITTNDPQNVDDEILTNITVDVKRDSGEKVDVIINLLNKEELKIVKKLEKAVFDTNSLTYTEENINDPANYEFKICCDEQCLDVLETIDATNYDPVKGAFVTRTTYGIGQVLYIKETASGSANHAVKPDAIKVTIDESRTLTIVNDLIKKNINIHKVEKNNEVVSDLANVQFDLIVNGKVIMSKTTNEKGNVTFENLPVGVNYEIKEHVPAGYRPDTNVGDNFTVDMTHNYNSEVIEIVNTKEKAVPSEIKASIKIVKTDADNSKPLANAVFEIINKADNSLLETVTTDDQGIAKTREYPKGTTLIIKEKEAPEGYILSTNNIEVTIENNGEYTQTVTNEKEPPVVINGNITIVKVDEDTKAPIANVIFEIKNKTTGNVLETVTTNSEGKASTKNYEVGTQLVIHEVSAPEGYILLTEDIEVTIEHEGEHIQNITNKKEVVGTIEGNIKIVKTDTEDGKPLANAVFEIINKVDNNVLETVTTDEKGIATTKQYPQGTVLIIKEKTAPQGYVLSTNNIEVTIEHNGEHVQNITNDKEPVEVIEGSITIVKVDGDTKKPLKGVVFAVYEKSDDTFSKPITTKTTDANGNAKFENLPLGEYNVTEISSLNGYVNDLSVHNVILEANSKDQTVNIENFKHKAEVSVIKYENGTEKPLEGAVFELKDKKTGEVLETVTTNKEGVAQFGMYTFGRQLVIHEVSAPDGYVLDAKDIEFTVDYEASYIFEVYNSPKDFELEIIKVDSNNKELSGAEFIIKGIDGTEYGPVKVKVDKRATVKNLPLGKYEVTETVAPKGYKLLEKPVVVELKNDTPAKVELKVENLKQETNEIIVKKVDDATGKPLAGAVFKLEYNNIDGEKVTTSVTTGKDGTFTVSNFPIGNTIVITETKAPDGYILNDKPIKLTTSEENKGYTVTVKNVKVPGSIEVVKVDKDTDKPLMGAEICVYEHDKVNDKFINKVCKTTDSTGTVKFDNLKVGSEYKVEEVKAPKGYILDAQTKLITIVDSSTIKVKMVNEKALNRVIITKLDSTDHNKKLEGAEFKLCEAKDKECKNPVAVKKTDKDGKVVFDKVKAGDYYVYESSAPNGYEIGSNNKVSISFSEGNVKDANVTMYNSPKKEEPPKKEEKPPKKEEPKKPEINYTERPNTGEEGINPVVMIGCAVGGVALCATAIYYFFKKKKPE